MFAPDIKFTPGMAMLLVSSLTCVGPREAPEPADSGGVHAGTGEARGALCHRQTITNVIVLPETYRWEDPAHVLSVAEGFGPRTLDVAVSASVQPTVSITGTATGTVTPAGTQPATGTTGIPGVPPIFGIPGLPSFFGTPGTGPGSGMLGTPGMSFFPNTPGAPGTRAPTDCQPPWNMSEECTPSNGQPWWSAPSNGAPSNGAPSNGAPSNGAPSNGAPSNGALPGSSALFGPGSCGLTLSDVSAALGFSVSETITLQASSTYFVPTAAYARVSAYPVFQKITWDVVSIGSWSWGASPASIVVASGFVLKPVGVYFATYRAYDLAAMGGGVVSPGPLLDPPVGAGGGSGAGDPGTGGAAGTGGDPGTGGAAGTGGAGGDPGTGGAGAAGGTGGAGGSGGP
ncbi:hypothetical protein WME94_10145 [Sorangium sp. So ce429]